MVYERWRPTATLLLPKTESVDSVKVTPSKMLALALERILRHLVLSLQKSKELTNILPKMLKEWNKSP